MKIGIFSDLHSNVYALRKMLALEPRMEAWICLGDFVGLFPPVNAVISELRAIHCVVIKGDHEEYLLSNRKMAYSFTGNDSLERQRKDIAAENRAYIAGLHSTLSFAIDGVKMLLLHALRGGHEPRRRRYAMDLEVMNAEYPDWDIVLYGDTHLPVIAYGRDVVALNPGSCGFPIDKIGKPSYMVLDTRDLSCRLKRFDYDKTSLLMDITAHGYHRKLYDFVKSGCWKK